MSTTEKGSLDHTQWGLCPCPNQPTLLCLPLIHKGHIQGGHQVIKDNLPICVMRSKHCHISCSLLECSSDKKCFSSNGTTLL